MVGLVLEIDQVSKSIFQNICFVFKLTVLANVVEFELATCIRPEPSLGSIKPGAVIVTSRKVPEGD